MDIRNQKKKWKRRTRKTLGVRRRLKLASDRPRLSIYRSSKHISVQLINDLEGTTMASASSLEKAIREQMVDKTKSEIATLVGAAIAERAASAGVAEVKFDRGRFLFHGRVKALADAAREGGLKF